MPCGASLFCYIGNYVKNRAASTERLGFAKQFGSGNGHGPLFCTSINRMQMDSGAEFPGAEKRCKKCIKNEYFSKKTQD